jgi:hypothetical protein
MKDVKKANEAVKRLRQDYLTRMEYVNDNEDDIEAITNYIYREISNNRNGFKPKDKEITLVSAIMKEVFDDFDFGKKPKNEYIPKPITQEYVDSYSR